MVARSVPPVRIRSEPIPARPSHAPIVVAPLSSSAENGPHRPADRTAMARVYKRAPNRRQELPTNTGASPLKVGHALRELRPATSADMGRARLAERIADFPQTACCAPATHSVNGYTRQPTEPPRSLIWAQKSPLPLGAGQLRPLPERASYSPLLRHAPARLFHSLSVSVEFLVGWTWSSWTRPTHAVGTKRCWP